MTGLAGLKCDDEHSEGLFKLAPRMDNYGPSWAAIWYMYMYMCVCVCIYIHTHLCNWFAVSSRVKMKFGWSLLSSTPLTSLRPLKYISQHMCIIAYVLGLLAWLVFQDLLSLLALESILGECEQMTSECSTPWFLLLMFRVGSKFCFDHTEVN